MPETSYVSCQLVPRVGSWWSMSYPFSWPPKDCRGWREWTAIRSGFAPMWSKMSMGCWVRKPRHLRMQTERWHFPLWLWYALLCIFWWGLWGFLSKIGSEKASPMQMQILFTLGMLPVALGMLAQMRGKLDRNRGGIAYGLLSGVATGLGTLGYYAALRDQNASVVTPLTGVFPVLTVVLAFVVLRERLNRVQMGGMLLALASIIILSI